MKDLHERIIYFRKKSNLTQKEVSEKIGLTHSNYVPIEKGRTKISIDKIEKLAEIFNVSISELLGIDNSSVVAVDNSEALENLRKENESLQKELNFLKEIKQLSEKNLKFTYEYLEKFVLDDLFPLFFQFLIDSIQYKYTNISTFNGNINDFKNIDEYYSNLLKTREYEDKEAYDKMSMEDFVKEYFKQGIIYIVIETIEKINLFEYQKNPNIFISKLLNVVEKDRIKEYIELFEDDEEDSKKANYTIKDFEEYIDMKYRHEFPKARKAFEVEAMKKAFEIYKREEEKKNNLNN